MTQPTSNSPQTIEDLIQNPFLDPTHESSQKFDDLGVISNKVITNHQLIQQLPEPRPQQARELAKQINEEDMQSIITYGANAQSQLKDFSNAMLEHIQVKDVTGIGDAIVDLMTQLQQNDPKELSARPNLLQKVFGKVKTSISETTLRYQQISTQIDRVAIRLERDQNELLNDNVMLESFYEKNRDYFEALNVYIAASEVKMQELQEKTIPAALEKAQASQDAMDIQKVNDLNQFLERLDKRTHDLRLTRQLTIQQAPQIRMIQNTNQLLAEMIQASIMTAIPLWENQITIALAILRQQNAAVSQQMVSDTTNNLLLKNSEMLKQSTIDVAREAERGVIDIETLRQTQNNLLSALSETLQIQQTGRQQRIQAETELIEMENDLRNQLLSITQNKQANH